MLLYVDSNFLSPYAMSAFVALHEKGLPFQLEKVDLGAGQNNAPDYAAISLTQRVPTLIDEGFSLSESSAIAEYLNDMFPWSPLYPGNTRSLAKARQMQAWLRSDLYAIRNERPTEVIFCERRFGPLSGAAQVAAEKLFRAAFVFLGNYENHLFGQWCIADADLALMLNRLVMHGDPIPERLAAYARRQWERPSIQQWVAHQKASARGTSSDAVGNGGVE